jgi:hypothetical protein
LHALHCIAVSDDCTQPCDWRRFSTPAVVAGVAAAGGVEAKANLEAF